MAKYYKFALYLLIVILINFVGLKLFLRIDLTANNLYSLSKASKQAVSTLKEPLTINVFFSKNLPAPYNNIEKYLHDLLEEYAIHGKQYFNYRFYDVSAKEGDLSDKAEENRARAQEYGIYPVNVQRIEQDEAKVQRAYMGIVFIHGDIIEKLPAITSTEGLEYNITSTIQKMNNKISALLNLPEKIKVKLVQSSSLSQIAQEINLEGLEALKNQIAEIVDTLNTKTYDRLEFIAIDPSVTSLSEADQVKYQRFGLQWPELKKLDGTAIPAGTGILALGIEYGNKSLEKRLLNQSLGLTSRGLQEQFQILPMEQVSTFIEENVENLINIHEEIGYLSSHGTLLLGSQLPPQLQMMQPQTGSLTRFNTLLGNQYSITQIDITTDEISDSIDTLIIGGPKENFSDWELFQIDQFLMKGKALAIYLNAFNEIQPQRQQQMYGMQQPVYIPVNTGLEKLLDHYGVSVKKSYIMDESCFTNTDPNSGQIPIYFAPIIKNENINHKLDFLQNIKEMIMIKISPVEIDTEKLETNGLKASPLFASTDASWEMSGRIDLNPWMIRPPMNEEDKKSHTLAYILEGEFPSYFADKPIPEKPVPEEEQEESDEESKDEQAPEVKAKPATPPESKIKGEKSLISKGRPGKILLLGTAEILKDNVLDEAGNSPNAVFLMNSIDYLNNRSDIAIMRSKNQRFNPLKDTKPITRTFVKILNIAGLPALFILGGFFIWFRRKARRKFIMTLFQQRIKPPEEKP